MSCAVCCEGAAGRCDCWDDEPEDSEPDEEREPVRKLSIDDVGVAVDPRHLFESEQPRPASGHDTKE